MFGGGSNESCPPVSRILEFGMDEKENMETAQIEKEGKAPSDWNMRDALMSAALVAFIIIAPLGGIEYLNGRFNIHSILFDACIVVPTGGILVIVFVIVSTVQLLCSWKRYTNRKRLIRIAQIGIPIVFITLFIVSVFTPVESHLPPPGVIFLYGFRDRVKSRADVPAIRNWLETLDKRDYVPQHDYYSADKLPEPLKRLGLGKVSLSKDNDGNPQVRISTGGGFNHWGAAIGLEDMVIPESDLSFHYDAWLLVEPGVYVYGW